jgi:hypothetical protein
MRVACNVIPLVERTSRRDPTTIAPRRRDVRYPDRFIAPRSHGILHPSVARPQEGRTVEARQGGLRDPRATATPRRFLWISRRCGMAHAFASCSTINTLISRGRQTPAGDGNTSCRRGGAEQCMCNGAFGTY